MVTSTVDRRSARTRERTKVGGSPVGVAGVVILGVLMTAAMALALYGLWAFWPAAAPATGSPPASARFVYIKWHVSLTRDQQFLMLVALAGALGGLLHGLRSLATYVGERYLFRSWLLYYAVLPFVAAALATIVYLVLRAGLLSGASNASQTDPYGIAAIAALVGLFSAQAAEKLKAVFETLFTPAEKGSESVSEIATPTISGLRPSSGQVGQVVTIEGQHLSTVTAVTIGGVPATIGEHIDTRITVTVPLGAVTGSVTLHAGDVSVSSDRIFTVTG
jgi:IPT/TIG domain